MHNLAGDEKGGEVKELANFFFLYICILTLCSLEEGMQALLVGQSSVGGKGSTMLVVTAFQSHTSA